MKKWKKIISAILVCVIVVTLLGGVSALFSKETKTISPTVFSRGDLNEKGVYITSKRSLYTKDMFECSGLNIQQDFESNSTYDVYFYDYAGKFLKSEKGLVGDYSIDEEFELAKFARVVIHPEIPEDVKENEFEIKFWEIYGFANDLTVSVFKEQRYFYQDCLNLYDEKKVTVGNNSITKQTPLFSLLDENGELIYDYYDIWVNVESEASYDIVVYFMLSNTHNFDIDGSGWHKVTVDATKESSEEFYAVIPYNASSCYILGYN